MQEPTQAEMAGGHDRPHRKRAGELTGFDVAPLDVIGARVVELGVDVCQHLKRCRFVASLFLVARQLDTSCRRAKRLRESSVEAKRLGQARTDRAWSSAADSARRVGRVLDQRNAMSCSLATAGL